MSKSNIIRKLLDAKNKLQDALGDKTPEKSASNMLKEYTDLNKEYRKLTRLAIQEGISPDEEARIAADRVKLFGKMMDLEKAMPKLSISDFGTNLKTDATDDELLKYATNFLDLKPSEMDKLHMGSGAFKDSYEIPGTGLVLKKSGGIAGTENGIIKDYFGNRVMEDTFHEGVKTGSNQINDPEWKKQFLERPKLIVIPEREPVLIQKKLINLEPKWHDKVDINPEDMYRKYRDNIDDTFVQQFKPRDLHSGNLGIDHISGKVKAFDAMPSDFADRVTWETIPKFRELLDKLKKPNVFRSIAPVVAKGALATAGGLVSLGEAMADTSTGNEGEVAEVKAMREQEKQRKFREAHPEMKDVFEKADTHLSEFGPKDYDLKPVQEKPEFKKLRGIFK
jgi:hypothetical protein